MKPFTEQQKLDMAIAEARTYCKPDATDQEIKGFIHTTIEQYGLVGAAKTAFLNWADNYFNI